MRKNGLGDETMIEFEPPKPIVKQNEMLKLAADYRMRPISRYYDEHEHDIPWDFINFMHSVQQMSGGGGGLTPSEPKKDADGKERPRIGYQMLAFMLEMLSYGDVGLFLCVPGGGLGSAAIEAAGTPEQKEKFLARYRGEKPAFGAMAITEAGAGSDNSAIRTTAVLDKEKNEWILNGEKIFVTGGQKSLEKEMDW
jgi:acyl-CoA dehydrogenase